MNAVMKNWMFPLISRQFTTLGEVERRLSDHESVSADSLSGWHVYLESKKFCRCISTVHVSGLVPSLRPTVRPSRRTTPTERCATWSCSSTTKLCPTADTPWSWTASRSKLTSSWVSVTWRWRTTTRPSATCRKVRRIWVDKLAANTPQTYSSSVCFCSSL